MAQLPFELQKLPPSALDVLRYFAHNNNAPADDGDITSATGLTDRSFSKAIKRLVTKKFAEMDAFRNYKLTDKGMQLLRGLMEYDAQQGGGQSAPTSSPATSTPPPAQPVQRQLTVVVPEPFIVNEPAKIYVGLDGGLPQGEADLIFRLTCLNAEPATQEMATTLGGGPTYAAFEITPSRFTALRLRIEAYQADSFSGSLDTVGGLYVDVDITGEPNANNALAAFGTEVTLQP